MTREIIEDYRKIILPFMKKKLLEINYENQGESDADEFEKDFNEILNLAAKALEQEHCEDKRLYIKVFADLEPDDIAEKIYQICDEDKFPKVIESLKEYFDSEPCENVISRQAVLDMLENINAETEGVGFYYEHYVEYIKNLPPVTPQPFINKPCVSEGVCREDKIQVLDKIKAEIEQLTITEGGDDYVRKMAELFSLKMKVLHIIDKYKAESEG